MADEMLARLDQLQRGARETHSRRQEYHAHDGYSRYDAYDPEPDYDDQEEMYGDDNIYPSDLQGNVPAAYPKQYSEHPSLRSQMPPPQPGARSQRLQAPPAGRGVGSSIDLSRFQYDDAHGSTSSSSPYDQRLPTSPVVSAGRRRSAVTDQTYRRQPTQLTQHSQPSYHQYTPGPPVKNTEYDDEYGESFAVHAPENANPPATRIQTQKAPTRDTPVVRGIMLVSTQKLPDRFRSIFPFPLFNAVQSKCFPIIYNTNDNFVLSSPTGSGKTAVLELAICRMMNGFPNGSYKVIYQAPTKSLCSERQRDWQRKFGPFDLQVAELTGDTDNAQLRSVAHASIIVTTPEKWDSITRKWKDHQKLMQMVKLFLIDEVHILKEDRGATLEAIVSRMKSVGCDIRFVALSATVPNSQDIATWLGKDSVTPHLPAPRERFGEEFRPVPLTKHVCGYQSSGNDFAFEKTLKNKLPDIIARWSQRKPIMVFCFTRSSCVETAKLLANWWATKGARDRYWEAPTKRVLVEDKELRDTVPSGVAYHHAGLSANDRAAIEKGYLEGDVNVICCTSTLAVGVNLPCHMVIIKNTVAYQNNGGSGGCKEYSDLEIMQMLGRAGRPQFDRSAVAIILTRLQKQKHYEKMVTGQEVLESCLHSNLIDHVNAEIGLGTITNASSAKRWLSGTFLYVRLKGNPEHYKIDGDASGRNLDERLEIICNKVISLLQEHDLVQKAPKLQCTEFGDAMARYYLQFETMKTLLALPPRAKTSEILSAIAQATEFGDVRFRGGEKATYKTLNQDSSIKFPIPVNLDAPAHKVSLIIQAVLGAIELQTEDNKQRMDFSTAKTLIFANAQRLIRCVVDCQLYLQDSVTARNALALARSLGAQVWDDSPLHMKQLDGVGLVSVRKLVAAGLKTVDDIENTEQHRLEQVLSRNPPLGLQLQEKARAFPKLRVGMKVVGDPVIRTGEHATVRIRADLGFINDKTPEYFKKQPVYVCLMAELSDGHLLHFARISAKKLNKGQDVMFEAKLTNAAQTVRAYVMCDSIAGTMRSAILQPDVPPHVFLTSKTTESSNTQSGKPISKRTSSKSQIGSKRKASVTGFDEFDDAGIDDADLALAENGGFENIDDFDDEPRPYASTLRKKQRKSNAHNVETTALEPRQLANGKWACNHNCKDKTSCKHLCCREGLHKKPKPSKAKTSKKEAENSADPKQTQLSLSVSKMAKTPAATQQSQSQQTAPALLRGPEMQRLNALYNNAKSNTQPVPLLSTASSKKNGSDPPVALPRPGQPRSNTTETARRAAQSVYSDDFGDINDTSLFDEHPAPCPSTHLGDFGDIGDMTSFDELAAHRPSTRPSPHQETASDLFATDFGDMLDNYSPVNKDNILSRGNMTDQDEHKNDSSSYGVEDDMLLPLEQALNEARQPDHSNAQQGTGGFAATFLEASDESASLELGTRANVQGSSSTVAKTPSGYTSAMMESHTLPQCNAFNCAVEERPASPDSAMKACMEELGTDFFNFTG